MQVITLLLAILIPILSVVLLCGVSPPAHLFDASPRWVMPACLWSLRAFTLWLDIQMFRTLGTVLADAVQEVQDTKPEQYQEVLQHLEGLERAQADAQVLGGVVPAASQPPAPRPRL